MARVIGFGEERVADEGQSNHVQLAGSDLFGGGESGFSEADVLEDADDVQRTGERGGPRRRWERVQSWSVIVGVLTTVSTTLPFLSRSVAVASICAGPSSKRPVVA